MSTAPTPPLGNAPESASPNGSGASGEGAGSALEAMVKKRQMLVDSPPDSAVPRRVQQQIDGGDHEAESGGKAGQ